MQKASLAALGAAGIILSLVAIVQRGEDPAKRRIDSETTSESDQAEAAARLAAPVAATAAPSPAPKQIDASTPRATARHILVSFKDSELGLVNRTRAEASTLARALCERLRNGEDGAELAASFSNDPYLETDHGIRRVANFGFEPEQGETPRARMPEAYAEVLFGLAPGGCGVADYDPIRCSLGYFVIQRIE